MDRSLYNEIIKEHFDIMDNDTRKILVSIDEADQNQVLGNLATKLYDSIVKKVTDIDFIAVLDCFIRIFNLNFFWSCN